MMLIIYHDGDIIGRTYLDEEIQNYPFNYIAIKKQLYRIVDRRVIRCVGDGEPIYNMYFTVVR